MDSSWNQNASILAHEDFTGTDLSACFKLILNNLAIGIFALKSGLLINTNKAFLRCLGCEDVSEIEGTPFADFIFPEDRTLFGFDDRGKREGRIDGEKMLRLLTKDGRIVWTHIGIKRMPCESKDFHLGYLVDLAQSKENCDGIAASLNRYRVIIDDAEDVFAENEMSNFKIWGPPQEQALGPNFNYHAVEQELRERNQFYNIVGQSQQMRSIYSLVENLADMDTTVLVTGESGTGKELVARALHYSGGRAFKPFVAVNCSALSESLLESELFGHVKGAFTGAIRSRDGRFQSANGGTILLDEIGDISPLIQVKLLRVLQEKTFERVGESEPRKVDVRIIACTNKDLKEKVRLGEFREDLYYRLKVVEIDLPPLREREGDIALLVDHFHRMFNKRFCKQIEAIDREVLGIFMDYSWPGNVRELEHVLEHVFVLCRDSVIRVNNLPAEFQNRARKKRSSLPQSPEETLTDANIIRNALIKTKGNKSKAARLLGISRPTIYRKIYQYQIPANI